MTKLDRIRPRDISNLGISLEKDGIYSENITKKDAEAVLFSLNSSNGCCQQEREEEDYQ